MEKIYCTPGGWSGKAKIFKKRPDHVIHGCTEELDYKGEYLAEYIEGATLDSSWPLFTCSSIEETAKEIEAAAKAAGYDVKFEFNTPDDPEYLSAFIEFPMNCKFNFRGKEWEFPGDSYGLDGISIYKIRKDMW